MSPPGASGPLASNFQITSSVGGTNLPFALGYAFRQGDVPSGQIATTADASSWQCTPRNYWPDGSLKFAVLAGRKTLTAEVAATITLSAGSAAGGTALTTADLKTAMSGQTCSIACGAFGTVSWATTDFDSPHLSWVSGPAMSSWVYRQPVGSDAHLVAWIEVRLFAGGAVEVLPWVENCYLTVASPTNKNAAYAFTLGGSQRFSAALDIKHHTRVPLLSGTTFSYWLGADPGITPAHNAAYLMATKVVPNYYTGATGPYTYTEAYTPNTIGDTSAAMGSAGFAAHIGILPQWSALYLAGGADPRAYRYVIANGLMAGAWSIHHRDQNTNKPPIYSDWPDVGILSGGTPSIPSGTGGVNQKSGVNSDPDTDHQPSLAYLPFLLTGRVFFQDEVLLWDFWNYMRINHQTREGASAIEFSGTGRGRGWDLRTRAQALNIVDSSHASYASIKNSWEQNTAAYKARWITGARDSGAYANDIGCVALYSGGGSSPYGTEGTYWWDAPWMQATITYAFGIGWDMGLPQSAQSLADHKVVRDFSYKQFVERAGDGSDGSYNYRRFSVFAFPYCSPTTGLPPTSWLPSIAAAYPVYDQHNPSASFVAHNALPAGTAMYYNNVALTTADFTSSTATCFNLAALTMAVDHGYPGAADGLLRIMNSSSFTGVLDAYKTTPVWGLKTREALPSWVPAVGVIANIGAATINNATPGNYPKTHSPSPMANWSGGVFVPDFGAQGGYAVHGSGHLGVGTTLFCGVWVLDLETKTWVGRNVPTTPLLEGQNFNEYKESTEAANLGHTYPPHTYQGLVVQPRSLGGGNSGSLLRVGGGGSGHKAVHRFDLSSASSPATRVIDNLWPELGSQTMAATALDEARGGFWAISDAGSRLKFVRFSDWNVTSYTSVTCPIERYGCMVYVPGRDCLVLVGGVPWSPSVFRVYVSQITGSTPAAFTQVATSGVTWPAEPMGSGSQWSTVLQKLVLYQGRVSNADTEGAFKVYTCAPPVNLTGGTWAWKQETMTGVAPGITTDTGSNVLNNGVFSRFVEAPAAKSFVYAGTITDPAQAFKLRRVDAMFPLAISKNARHIITAEGEPFFLHGDTAWAMAVQCTNADVDRYLEDRLARGFNAFSVNLIEHNYSTQTPKYRNIDGNDPFAVMTDFASTPNAAYWARVDYIVNGAKARGMVVLAFPAYLGFNGTDEGWDTEVNAESDADLQAYGAFLGNRYSQGNIIWVMGGDNAGSTVLRDKQWNIAIGIRSARPLDIITGHPARADDDSWNLWGPGGRAYIGFNLNSIYTGVNAAEEPYEESAAAYARYGPMPFVFLEDKYDELVGPDAARVRRNPYQAILSGACGHLFGNNPLWGFGAAIDAPATTASAVMDSSLNTTLTQQMAHVLTLFRSFQWWRLVPKTDASMVSSSLGTGTARVCPAREVDGKFAMVYTPASQTVTVVLSALSVTPLRVRLFDPSTGGYSTHTASIANTGTLDVATGGERVIVLDAA